MRLLVIVVTVALLLGCQPLTANGRKQAVVDSIVMLSGEVDMAERSGRISNETEDELQNQLVAALKIVRSGYVPNGTKHCEATVSPMACVQLIQDAVQFGLKRNGQ